MVEHIALPTPTSAALAALGSVDSLSVNMSLCGLYLHLSFPPGKFFQGQHRVACQPAPPFRGGVIP